MGFEVRAAEDVELVETVEAGGGRKGEGGGPSPSSSQPGTPTEERKVAVGGTHSPVSPLSPQIQNRKFSLLNRPSPDSHNFRALVVENQLQNVVVEVRIPLNHLLKTQ